MGELVIRPKSFVYINYLANHRVWKGNENHKIRLKWEYG